MQLAQKYLFLVLQILCLVQELSPVLIHLAYCLKKTFSFFL